MKKFLLWLYAFFLAIVFGFQPLRSFDLWWNLSSAAWTLQHNSFIYTDPFSYTAYGKPWMHHEWGAGMLFYFFFSLFGLKGLVWFAVIVFSGFLYFGGRTVQVILRRDSIPFFTLFFLAFLSTHRVMVRPHIFTNFFTALLLFIFYLYNQDKEKGKKWLAGLPLLFLVWANLHGGVLLGLGFLIFFSLEKLWGAQKESLTWSHPLVIVVVCALLLLCNPYSYHIYTFPFEHLNMKTIIWGTEEWQPPWEKPWRSQLVFQGYGVVLLGSLACLISSFRSFPLSTWLIGFVLGYLSLNHARYTALFSLWALPLLSFQLSRLASYLPRPLPILASLFFLWQGVPFSWDGQRMPVRFGLSGATAPVSAVDFIKSNGIKEKIFNEIQFGDYLILEGLPVFIDGRTPLYGDDFFREYLLGLARPDVFERLHNKWNFGVIMLSRDREWELRYFHRYLLNHPEWAYVYHDDTAYIYLIRSESHKSLIQSYERVESPVEKILIDEKKRGNP